MSSVPTFTERDIERRLGLVFEAARKFGKAEIRLSSGEVFILTPGAAKKKLTAGASGCVPPPASEHERINRIIAGEE